MRAQPSYARSFDDQLTRHLYVLVRVGPPPMRMHAGVPEFFSSAWPQLFGFLLLPEAETRQPGWWQERFRSGVGPVRQQPGYFLFHGGVVIGHHPGVIRPSSVQFLSEQELTQQRERVRRLAFFGSQRVTPRVLEAARQLTVYFDEMVERRQRVAHDDPWQSSGPDPRENRRRRHEDRAREERQSRRDRRSTSSGSPPPRAAAGPGASDHFETLGITADAADADVRKAYRVAMKLNHPDKVAHLSPALQKFAEAQVLLIQAAYEAIMASRR